MSCINSYVHALEKGMWTGVQGAAEKCPQTSRLLAFPVAVEILCQSILEMPAKCCEAIILTAKDIILLAKSILCCSKIKQDPEQPSRIDSLASHFAFVIYYGIGIPLYPLIGVIRAVTELVLVLADPLKLSKMVVADLRYEDFLKEQKLSSQAMMGSGLIAFPTGRAFAHSALKRYKAWTVIQKTHSDLLKRDFLASDFDKRELINEVAHKVAKVEQGMNIYKEKHEQLHKSYKQKLLTESQGDIRFDETEEALKLKQVWEDFQKRLVDAEVKELPEIAFVTPA